MRVRYSNKYGTLEAWTGDATSAASSNRSRPLSWPNATEAAGCRSASNVALPIVKNSVIELKKIQATVSSAANVIATCHFQNFAATGEALTGMRRSARIAEHCVDKPKIRAWSKTGSCDGNSGSVLKSTKRCSLRKVESVPCAVTASPRLAGVSSTSIMIMKQARFADFSAHHAIRHSDCSRKILTGWQSLQNTYAASGKRPHNNRDARQDGYDELLDFLAYALQVLQETPPGSADAVRAGRAYDIVRAVAAAWRDDMQHHASTRENP
jgi:hypothetical protein